MCVWFALVYSINKARLVLRLLGLRLRLSQWCGLFRSVQVLKCNTISLGWVIPWLQLTFTKEDEYEGAEDVRECNYSEDNLPLTIEISFLWNWFFKSVSMFIIDCSLNFNSQEHHRSIQQPSQLKHILQCCSMCSPCRKWFLRSWEQCQDHFQDIQQWLLR